MGAAPRAAVPHKGGLRAALFPLLASPILSSISNVISTRDVNHAWHDKQFIGCDTIAVVRAGKAIELESSTAGDDEFIQGMITPLTDMRPGGIETGLLKHHAQPGRMQVAFDTTKVPLDGPNRKEYQRDRRDECERDFSHETILSMRGVRANAEQA
jgi:hypothetical protein